MLFQPFCNLRRSQTVDTEGENLLHDGCGFFIDNPFLFVLRVFAYTRMGEWLSDVRRIFLCSAM